MQNLTPTHASSCSAIRFLCVSAIAALLAGCSNFSADRVDRMPGESATRRLVQTTPSQVAPVARKVFRARYRLDTLRSTDSLLFSHPTEEIGEFDETEAGEPLPLGKTRHRIIARLTWMADGDDVLLVCQVARQRLETARKAAFSTMRGDGDDRPTDTPIDRRGAVSAESKQEWVYIGRDRQAEQAILGAIRTALQPEE
jgi:hypothetical protein